MKIFEYFLINLKKTPNKIFIKSEKISYTYNDINNLFVKFEKINILGKYITIISNNSVYFFILYLISSKYNKVFVPLDNHLSIQSLNENIKKFNLDNIFCFEKTLKKLKKIGIKKKLINIEKLKEQKKINYKRNKIFLLTFSSGSTSYPKPIAISEKTKIDRAKSNIKIFNLKSNDRIIISTPLHHTLAIRLMTIGIILGSEISFLENYKLDKFLRMIKKNKSKFTYFVSNQLEEISKNKNNIKYLSSLKCIVSSSSKLPLDTKKKLKNLYKKNIYEIYGLSEAAIVSNLNLRKDRNFIDSVGKSIPGVKIKIKKLKGKKNVGEILIKSKFLCLGYIKKNKLEKLNNQNYFHTGDLGYLKNNFLYFSGRKKNMIKINGVSIYLEDIENTLMKNKLINDCVARPVDFKDKINPRICLIYQGSKTISSLRNYCFKNLSVMQIPSYYLKVKLIPRNKMGKLNTKLVNAMIQRKIN